MVHFNVERTGEALDNWVIVYILLIEGAQGNFSCCGESRDPGKLECEPCALEEQFIEIKSPQGERR